MKSKTRGEFMAAPQQAQSPTLHRVMLVGEAVAGIALIASAVFLPWITYQAHGSSSPSHMHAGLPGVLLILIGCATLVLTAGQALSQRRWLMFCCCGLGALALLLTVVTAATRMAHANSLTIYVGGSTLYAIGPVFAALAAVAAIAIAAAQVNQHSQR